MKKLPLTIMAVLILTLSLPAQIDLGVRLGANYPFRGFSGDAFQEYIADISDPSAITAYTGGVFAGVNFGSFGIQLEGNLALEGFSIARIIEGDPFMEVISGTTVNTEYINVLLMARYQVDIPVIQPYIAAGVNVGLPLMTIIENPNITFLENYEFSQTGFAVSVGLRLLSIISVDLRYSGGITDICSGQLDTTHPLFGQLIRLSLGLHLF
ncbi:MAG: outer membrane beta-barrel protein [Candidatus Marinimicrobia bacterium]|jgi:hypothetical protein|nr:outer membrane beta-barrel protein [Candidatus Neomarinimicrobiota bacterium]MDD4961140.1 outer membrane beta-barrel protein [Candidatus Neomarinimicrobiota bacterium]MDD5709055.1 outer membrane beta-barrel protein [Candidatus Neomarinimicrobiota bacterium]MDX9777598.1 outer membrane beta-barrel protein [bacterium]